MADTTKKSTTTSRKRTAPAASGSTSTRAASSRNTTEPARKSSARATTARRTRNTAGNETTKAAEANVRAAKATAAETRSYAERVILTYTGAVLTARDNVVELADSLVKRYGSVDAVQRNVSRDLTKFERRGVTARDRVERELRQRREAVVKRASAVTDVVGGQIKATGEQVKALV
jgi:hypothetical protein